MTLWLRLIKVLIAGLFRRRLAMTGQSVLRFRVWPDDLDINVHMNNARYLAVMDMGRFDLIARAGLWRPMAGKGWRPVIGGALVRYRRSLRPFQSFTLRSRMLFWDERWIYIEHRIEAADGSPACLSVARVAFLGDGGTVPPSRVAGELGFDGTAPPVPAWAVQWGAVDDTVFDQPAPPRAAE